MVKKFGPGTHTCVTDPWNSIRIKYVSGSGQCTLKAFDDADNLQCENAVTIPAQGHNWVEVPDVGMGTLQNSKVQVIVPQGSSISIHGEFTFSQYSWTSE